jgi:hypothetical protein
VLSRAQAVEKAMAADLKPWLSSRNWKTMSSWLEIELVIIFMGIITLFYGFSENSILFFKDAGNPNLSKNNLEMRKKKNLF